MLKIFSVIASATLFFFLFSSSALAPLKTDHFSNDSFNEIFQDIVADYALYTALLYDVYPIDQYLVSLHTNDPDSTAAYLMGGFDPALAAAIANYYLQWIPELNQMAVIPGDSIPVITEQDKPYITMQQICPDKVVLKRVYTNCYEIGDMYLYLITAEKKEGHWFIVDLQLNFL
jgi:hypothetical protein